MFNSAVGTRNRRRFCQLSLVSTQGNARKYVAINAAHAGFQNENQRVPTAMSNIKHVSRVSFLSPFSKFIDLVLGVTLLACFPFFSGYILAPLTSLPKRTWYFEFQKSGHFRLQALPRYTNAPFFSTRYRTAGVGKRVRSTKLCHSLKHCGVVYTIYTFRSHRIVLTPSLDIDARLQPKVTTAIAVQVRLVV